METIRLSGMDKLVRFLRGLCFWRKPKKYPPLRDGRKERVIQEGVLRYAHAAKFTAKAATTTEELLRMHVVLEDKIGRGLKKSEWVGVAEKVMRRQLLKAGWFFRRDNQYFVNRRKIIRTFGEAKQEVAASA